MDEESWLIIVADLFAAIFVANSGITAIVVGESSAYCQTVIEVANRLPYRTRGAEELYVACMSEETSDDAVVQRLFERSQLNVAVDHHLFHPVQGIHKVLRDVMPLLLSFDRSLPPGMPADGFLTVTPQVPLPSSSTPIEKSRPG